jgi:hypothetical protein
LLRALAAVIAFALFLAALAPPDVYAQTGRDDNLSCNILARWSAPSGRQRTSMSPAEPGHGRMDGQLFYVPSGGAADRAQLRRHYHAQSGTFLDSKLTIDRARSGNDDLLLGFPFQKQIPGTQPITRGDGHVGFGYPRFGNAGEELITVRGEEVTLSANLVAGGTVNELWWGGKQFINNYDYGRQIQFAANLGRPASGKPEDDNPTEGGDIYGWAKYPKKGETDPTDQAAWAHGSPIDRAGTYVDQANNSLVTRCWPLQWNPGAFGWGANRDHPVVWWKGTFSKQVTLDCRLADGIASPNVIRWSPSMYLPTTTKPITVQVVAGFLDEEFHVYEMFDASREYVEGLNPTDFSRRIVALGKEQPAGALDSELRAEPRLNPKAGGSILSTPGGKYALGCYRGPSAASPNLRFALQDFRQIDYPVPPERKYSFKTAAFFALYRHSDGLAGGRDYTFPVYLVVGSRATVIAEMQRLWRLGM